MVSKKFIELDHTADIKFIVSGKSLEEVFENVSFAFSDYISSKKGIVGKKKLKISISADNKENLLYKFIDELIFLLDAKSFAVKKSKLKINQEENSLTGVLIGSSTKKIKLVHVKAATYSEMYIKKIKNYWKAQVVFDV